MCLFGFAYYLSAVIFLENIFALVYWNTSVPAADPPTPDPVIRNVLLPPGNSSTPRSSGGNSATVHGGVGPPGTDNGDGEKPSAGNDDPGGKTSTTGSSKPEADVVTQSSPANSSIPSHPHAPTTEDLEADYYRLRETRVNPYVHSLTLRPRSLCDNDTYMIILIHSHHPYSDRRTAIRNTWGSVTWNGTWPNLPRPVDKKIRLVFMLGTHKDPGLNDLIRDEWSRFDDIAQGDFFDSYRNMTLKSLLGLKLVAEHCSTARYLLKNDDDMIVNVPYLVQVLENRTLTRAIMGPLNVGSKVYRNGKWKVSKAEFPFNFYPPYESGAAYLITADLVRELFAASEYVPSIFIDDVYITGILGRILNVTHARQAGFAYWTNKAPKVCDVAENRIISGTKMTPKLLVVIWDELRRGPSCGTIPDNPRLVHRSP